MKAFLLLLFFLQIVQYGELADITDEADLKTFVSLAQTSSATEYGKILFYKDTPVAAQKASTEIKKAYGDQITKIGTITPITDATLQHRGIEALRVYYLRMEQKYLSDLTTACPAAKLDPVRALTTLDETAARAQFGIAASGDYNLNQLSQGYKDARICMADDFSSLSDPDKLALAVLHHLFVLLLENMPTAGKTDLGQKGDLEVERITAITNVEQSANAIKVLFQTIFGEEKHDERAPNDPVIMDMARIYSQKMAMLDSSAATTGTIATDKPGAITKLKEAYGGELVRLINAERAAKPTANLFDFIFDAFKLKPTTNARLYKDYKAKKDAIDEVTTHKLSINGINEALDELMLAYGDNLVDSINTVKNPNDRAAEATAVFDDDELPTTATALDDFEKIFDEKKAAIQKAVDKKKQNSELAMAVLIGSYLRRRTDTTGHPFKPAAQSAQKGQLIAHIDTITGILELKADADKRKVFNSPKNLKDLDAAFDAIKAQLDTIEKDVDAKVTGAKLVDAEVDAVVKETLHQLMNLRTPILIDLISAEKTARPNPADRKTVAESIFDTFSKTPAKMDDLRAQYETKKTGIQAAIKATPTDANAVKSETVLMDAFLRILERATDHPFQSDQAKRTDLLKNIDIISDILEANLANDNLKMLNNPADLAQLAANFKTMKDALDFVKAATATSANVNTDVEEIYNKAFAALDTARIDLEKRLQPQPAPGGSPGGSSGSPGAQPGGPAQPGQPGAPGQTLTQKQTFGPPTSGQFPVGTAQQEMTSEFDGKPPVRMPDAQCQDASTNCLKNIRLCHLESYIQVMHSNCARTCRVCFPASEPCDDLNKFDCPTWTAQGFCQSRKRSKALKMLQCAKSCGLCPSP